MYTLFVKKHERMSFVVNNIKKSYYLYQQSFGEAVLAFDFKYS